MLFLPLYCTGAQECGEEVWETILRESGARNTVFSMQQQYPDTLMLRLASALTRIVTNDPNSPATSRPNSPCPKKLSFKIKPSWRSASVHTDNRIQLRCPFTATNALTAVTKNEINAYNSSEEIASHALSVDRINEGVEFQIRKKVAVNKDLNRRSLGFKLEDKKEENKKVEIPKTCLESTCNNQDVSPKDSAPTSPCSSNSESTKVNSILKNNTRKTSVNLAMDVYKRRGSGVSTRPRFNSISLVSSDRLNTLKEKFSTPEKVMHFFGRCFVKFFSNYGYDTMIRATGRYFCTFLQSVDNIHQRMRFTFPRMRSPSMQLTRAHIHGAELVYSSTRTGFTHYLMGQLYEIAEDLFSLKLKMSIVKESMEGSYYVAVLRLEFDNSDYLIHAMYDWREATALQSILSFYTCALWTNCTLGSYSALRVQYNNTFRALLRLPHFYGAPAVFADAAVDNFYAIMHKINSTKMIDETLKMIADRMDAALFRRFTELHVFRVQSLMLRKNLPCPLPAVPASLLLQLFPFGVLLDRKMKILSAGDKLVEAWGGPFNRIQKSPIGEILRLRKPKVSFTWDKVVCMQTMLFELELMRWRARTAGESRRGSQGARAILLKGPIYFLEQIDALIFLCSPIFNDLDELRQAGLYLADMNGHGLSKEMLLQGWQHLSRLELLFEKAETRSLSLEKSCRLRDQWKKRGDQLLYSMIPKPIAEHLRAGKDPMSACQAYDSVTIMFCGLQIAEAGTRADVMQTVAYMNDVYSRIDRLLDSHRVYKVETVGTVYMLVSGAPERRRAHAASAASAALAVSRALPVLTIGIHSGPCVAGVLGLKLPRFCLVGDTVNTASRMQTTSEPGKIHVSAQTAAELPSGKFRLRSRGPIKVKGKGMMETFWLEGEVEEDEQDEALQLFSALCGE